jgi:hypothetical protein
MEVNCTLWYYTKWYKLTKTDIEMENTFELTDEHTIMLDGMNDAVKDTAKQVVNTLGYYQSIQLFMDELKMSEDKAKILADIGCYILKDYE